MREDLCERLSEHSHPRRNHKAKYPRNTKKFSKADEDGMPIEDAKIIERDFRWKHHPYPETHVLHRWLMGQRGRIWNDVYSEICTQADSRSEDGRQMRQGIEWMVETNIYRNEAGELVSGSDHRRWWGDFFYVDPETQKLEWTGPRKRHRWSRPIEQKIFEVDGQNYYLHDDGLWYRVEMALVPDLQNTSTTYWWRPLFQDAFDAKRADPMGYKPYWQQSRTFPEMYGLSPEGKAWYVAKKESASKKEIKKLKKNLPQAA